MFPVEAFRDTLRRVAAIFGRHAIRFHLTGGLTTVLYGEPRMTQDIDIVVDNRAVAQQLESFYASLVEAEFLADMPAIRQAVEDHGMFQLFDTRESLKLDIYPRELVVGELARSQLVEVFEATPLPVASRADATVSKLIWISKGSSKSRRDLRHIYRTNSDVDRTLVDRLATELGLKSLLAEVLSEADEIHE